MSHHRRLCLRLCLLVSACAPLSLFVGCMGAIERSLDFILAPAANANLLAVPGSSLLPLLGAWLALQ